VINFACPKCGTELEVPRSDAGTKISCPECGQRLAITGPKPAAPKGPAVGSSSSTTRDRPTAAPPPRKGPAATGRPRPDPDTPPPSKTAAKPKRRPRDEDEEEDDRPRRKGQKKRSSSGPPWVLIGVGGGGLLAVAVAAVILVVVLARPKPNDPVVNGPPVPPPGMVPPMPVRGGPQMPDAGKGGQPADPGGKTAEPSKEPDLPEVQMPAADGQKVYKYLLKSTALIIHGISMGSGSLIDRSNRLVLTNYHVVGDSDVVFVFFPPQDGKPIPSQDYFFKNTMSKDALIGKVLHKEMGVDLAILQLNKLPDGIEALPLATGRPAPGTQVYSVGHPGASQGLWLYTHGEVRQLLHMQWMARGHGEMILKCDANVVLTNSATNPGDSGGPLVNGRGELVAVVHGTNPNANLMSVFIDGSEVRGIFDRYTRESGTKVVFETKRSLGTEADADNLPTLVRKLEDKDSAVRANAARALGGIGPGAKLAYSPLLKALNDSDELVHRSALEALTKIGAPDKDDVPQLASLLKEGNPPDVRRFAAGALARTGVDARPAVPALLEALKDKDPALRQNAARALGTAGGDARDQVQPALTAALNDGEADVRAAAAEGLAALPLTGADTAAMTELLKHKDAEVRGQAAHALGKIGPEARTALKPLTEALQDKNAHVRRAAVEALGAFGADAKDSEPDLEKAVQKDSDKEVRRAAIDALGNLGAEAKAAAKPLADALVDVDLRKNAVAALIKIGQPAAHDAVPALAGLLKAPDKGDRLLALTAIEALLRPAGPDAKSGPEAKDVVPKLIAVFEDADAPLRDKAAETLARIGKPAVAGLCKAVRDPTKAVRKGAAQALGDIGAQAKDGAVINALTLQVQLEDDPDVKEACVKALAKIQR
jgi:HEAT repeat protein